MKRRWPIRIALVLVIVLILIPKILVVPAITKQLKVELQTEFQTDHVEVRLHAPLGWELIFGRLPGIDVEMKSALVDNLVLSEVQVAGSEIRFSPKRLFEKWEMAYEGAEKLEGTVTVTEKELNALLWEEVDPEQLFNFTITKQGLAVVGAIPLWGQEIAFTLHGNLEPVGGANVRFVPRDLEVQATRIPPFLLEVLNQSYDLVLDFSIFPYPVAISQILFEDAKLQIKFGVIL